MHADDAARIAAGAARLLAEARRVGAVANGQLRVVEDLVCVQVGEHDLGRGNEVEPLGGLEQVVLELGQLTRAGERVLVGKGGKPPLDRPPLDVGVEHEVDERALQAGAGAMQCVEACMRELHAAFEVYDAQLGPEVPVRLCLKVELARRTPASDLGIVVLVIAHGGVGTGDVGDGVGEGLELLLDLGKLGIELLDFVANGTHAHLGILGLARIALLHHLPDLLGHGVALGFEGLDLLDDFAAFFIEATKFVVIPLCVAVFQSLLDGFGVFANKANVEHCSSCA